MSTDPQGKAFQPGNTSRGDPAGAYRYPNGGVSYLYRDSVAGTEDERRERERSAARIIGEILLRQQEEGEGDHSEPGQPR